jgi:transposase InsO family protein
VRLPCRALDCPRAGPYRAPPAAAGEADLRRAVERLAGAGPTYGYRRLTAMLRREGRAVNGKRVRRVMAEPGLQGEAPPRRLRATDSSHAFPRYPNRVEGLAVERPEQVWVAGITYVRLRDGFVYLAVLMGAFTRRARGGQLGRSLDGSLALAALGRALRAGAPEAQHSDQGVQYAAAEYARRLTSRGVAVSVAAVGTPEENGYAERLMRAIQGEEVARTEYRDFAGARRRLGRSLDSVYNRKRIHSALGHLRPEEFEQRWRAGQAGQPPVP